MLAQKQKRLFHERDFVLKTVYITLLGLALKY